MQKIIVKGKTGNVTWIVLQVGDEVQTNEDTLRETALYQGMKDFVLDENTDLKVPYYLDSFSILGDNKGEIDYLDVKHDTTYGAYVEIPPEYEFVYEKDFYLTLKKIDKAVLYTEHSQTDWQKEVAEGTTQLGYSDWLDQKKKESD